MGCDTPRSVGVLGCGSMGGAIARGLVQSQTLEASQLALFDPDYSCVRDLAELGAWVAESAEELAKGEWDVLVLAVKPQILPDVVAPIAGLLAHKLVVSIAAGVNLHTLENLLPDVRTVRVMPNLPIQVRSGATAIAPGPLAAEEDVQLVRKLFCSLGSAQVMREDQLDAEGAVVSCGPAYVALFIDALTRAGVRAGLPAAVCRDMVEATVLGVAQTLLESGEHPRSYMERVTSPGGTTAAALYQMEPLVMEAAYAATDAALARTQELAGGK
ncbi:MAG: pyrroline-5-carboxylate reductase [Coriobacteriales bacterium]|nr:pyrroline-5-carboxylate reductase [Coriobacteriales bacterium]